MRNSVGREAEIRPLAISLYLLAGRVGRITSVLMAVCAGHEKLRAESELLPYLKSLDLTSALVTSSGAIRCAFT